jgi:NhaP-type Na+/H+ and K+/H+ antiporter
VTLTDGGGGTILETIALAAGASLSASGLGPRFTTSLVGAVTGAVTGSARVA